MLSGKLAVLAMALMLPTGAVAASTYKLLHKFVEYAHGAWPHGGLIFDATGNLYGTTTNGGAYGGGTVFKLTPNSDGTWTESVLYSFATGEDSDNPQGTLIFDATGNLYGTTTGSQDDGSGTVFKLTPNSDGSWTESVLYTFCSLKNCTDGANPQAGLIFDPAGNLYGTTAAGGLCNSAACGIVFKLTPNSDGSWTESVLYNFCSVSNCADGSGAEAGLIVDTAGNLYGTTEFGGTSTACTDGCGVAFQLTPNQDGSWTESVLHSFTSTPDGANPFAGLIFDAAGKNLYGTTFGGGDELCYVGCGVVFKLTPNSKGGSWTESVLHRFGAGPLAANPHGGLIFDAAGKNLYGTTQHGGREDGGAVFKLAPNSDGSRAYSVLHSFQFDPAGYPVSGLVLDKAGNLYGTTSQCGNNANCYGVVFEITP
jgi:uncharacterized repeat protein (TIGR03803 family)